MSYSIILARVAGTRKITAPAFKRAGVCLIVILMMTALLAVPASANSINTVEIRATIHSDGSATIKEVWDIHVTDDSNTEWYVAKHNLDNMDILGLSVQEDKGGSVVTFETLSEWKKNASRVEKAGKCGLLRANGGYEICWGFGELGHHKYTLTYTITNIVKGYQGGDAMRFNFLSEPAGGVDSLNIYLSSDHFSFEHPATRVWMFGYSADSDFADGGVAVLGNGRFMQSDYAAILLAFDPGLLSPAERRTETLDEIISLSMEGRLGDTPTNDSFDTVVEIIFILCFLVLPVLLGITISRKRRKLFRMLRKAPYCQELPFEGSIGATYARLCEIYNTNSGSIIGCFLLKWLQAGQVEMINADYGEPTIKLRATTPDLPLFEASLYRIFMEAAGHDMILRNKDFKKWVRKNLNEIQRWLSEYLSFYKKELIQMGVCEEVTIKRRFRKSEETELRDTPLAQDMTLRAFGFKRYLEDFTSVNERGAQEGGQPGAGCSDWPFQSVNESEVREVWDQYLVFAQLFGIADRVATQFKEFYPNNDYLNDLRHTGYSFYLTSIMVSNSFMKTTQLFVGGFAGAGVGGFAGGGGAGGR